MTKAQLKQKLEEFASTSGLSVHDIAEVFDDLAVEWDMMSSDARRDEEEG